VICGSVACSDNDDPAAIGGGPPPQDASIFGHDALADFAAISAQTCADLRENLRIYYGHTSHGSQIVTGLAMLAAENPQYEPPPFTEIGDDLGHNGDLSWAQITRDFLDENRADYDVVMWSWCGGVSDNTVEGIEAYLSEMTALEAEYPELVFVYMTGHLDGTGEDGNLRARNEQIRAYCRAHEKILFDFADIESYDPDGIYYPDASDQCEWCETWCAEHDCPDCGGCAHSHCFNCYQKGKVFWRLLAEL
jgi:hypothetical protein